MKISIILDIKKLDNFALKSEFVQNIYSILRYYLRFHVTIGVWAFLVLKYKVQDISIIAA